ncbi:hypothetical protein SeMB42_g02674 [Synchytrium endobioticum]|uniref:BPL/LPL catalytic domain-containing protein n=1 Tax=Synchytrium endobioticum TaxID=286115 RepID=A0A507DCG2_9FUNG|nr:hypothetical protein SeMB42_g02674 [Synchytrium endobioticum]
MVCLSKIARFTAFVGAGTAASFQTPPSRFQTPAFASFINTTTTTDTPNAMNVLVYADQGTAKTPIDHTLLTLKSSLSASYDVMLVDAKTLLTEPWENYTALLVIPGGRDLPYVKALYPEGTNRIRRYVEAGGKYLGICAGAYFACQKVEFEVNRKDYQVTGDRDLVFYKGIGRGSVFDGFIYGSEAGARAAHLQLAPELNDIFQERNVSMYHNGGPYFVSLMPDGSQPEGTKVLAYYADPDSVFQPTPHEKQLPAIISCQVGRGKAILSGSELALKLNQVENASQVEEELTFGPKLSELHLCFGPNKPRKTQDAESTIAHALLGGKYSVRVIEDDINVFNIHRRGFAAEKGEAEVPKGHKIPFFITVYSVGDYPLPAETPHFNVPRYYDFLRVARADTDRRSAALENELSFGSTIMYGEVLTSTQTILDKNLQFSKELPNGFTFVASRQVAGRGRGRNAWISSLGCLQFSFRLLHKDAASVIFVQYLIALAAVDAIKSKPGYEKLPIHLKWPNDIYVQLSPGQEGLQKIGGVLVNSSYQSVNQVIQINNARQSQQLPEVELEDVLARVLTIFEIYYQELLDAIQSDKFAFAFEPFLPRYYNAWLHSHVRVVLEAHGNAQAVITGIDSSGLLRCVGDNQQEYLLQPDGNSFDMMKGMIARKK